MLKTKINIEDLTYLGIFGNFEKGLLQINISMQEIYLTGRKHIDFGMCND